MQKDCYFYCGTLHVQRQTSDQFSTTSVQMKSYICLVLLFAAVNAVPQYGNFGVPAPALPGAELVKELPTTISNSTDGIESWATKIQDLVELTRTTLTSMGEIAMNDNPEVGARIVTTLQGEIENATKIFMDYTTAQMLSGSKSLGRRRRDVDNGSKAYNQVGDVLVGSDKNIDTDKKKLSPGAQRKMDKKYREGIKKCKADSCVAATAAITAAEDAQDERE